MKYGGDEGFIRVSNKCKYDVNLSFIVRRISLKIKLDSFSVIFSTSKSSDNFSNSGREYFSFSFLNSSFDSSRVLPQSSFSI